MGKPRGRRLGRPARREGRPDGSVRVEQVVHVVEAYGGGVAAAVSDYALSRPDLTHHLVYADRPDARVLPSSESLFASRDLLPPGHLARLVYLTRLMRSSTDDTFFHAHSSLAGVYVRLVSVWVRGRPTAYTPHCYGFERRDLARSALLAIYLVEKAMAWLSPSTMVAACSPRELDLARRLRRRVPGIVVPNIAPDEIGVHPLRHPPVARPVVIGAGRLTAQKDPYFFVAAIASLRRAGVSVDARWLGDGDPAMRAALEEVGVEVSGWLDRAEFTTRLGRADVYLHTALWEGFPLTILEAVAGGVPTLVRAIPCMVAYEFPVVLDGPDDLAAALGSLQDGATWAQVLAHHRGLIDECSREHQVAALGTVYG